MIVVILAVFIVVNMVTKDKGNSDVANQTDNHNNTISQTKRRFIKHTDNSADRANTRPNNTTTNNKSTADGGTLKVSGSVEKQDFVGADKFKDCVFLGDSIISGISFYEFFQNHR